MDNPALHRLLGEAIRAASDVLIVSSDPGPLVRVACEAAGGCESVSVACLDAGSFDAVRAASPKANAFRIAPVDLSVDVEAAEDELADSPPATLVQVADLLRRAREQALRAPIVPDDSFDVVVADRVLGLADAASRPGVLAGSYRVLRRHGVCLLADVVSDEPLPRRLAEDPMMPAVFQESELLFAMEGAKFHGIAIADLPPEPCAEVEGIECRPVIVQARKGKEGVCRDGLQAVIYLGPFKVVEDDDGHVIRRGERFAVCQKTFQNYQSAPYAGAFAYIEPRVPVPPEQAPLWDPRRPGTRSPSETKRGAALRSVSGTPEAASGDGGAYIAYAMWLHRDGTVRRRAKVAHRYEGCFGSRQDAQSMAQKVFPDASRYDVVSIPSDEVAALRERAARRPQVCSLPPSGPVGEVVRVAQSDP